MHKAVALLVALIPLSVHSAAGHAQDRTPVKVMSWVDTFSAEANRGFTDATGIPVQDTPFDSAGKEDMLLKTGDSAQDVVTLDDVLVGQGIATAKFRKLDKTKLPSLAHLDPIVMQATEAYDPEHLYSVPYAWGTVGISYNAAMVRERFGAEIPESWAMIFDPKIAAKLADCGIAMIDAPAQVLQSALIYLGRDPNSDRPEDTAAAEEVLKGVRPYVTQIHTWQHTSDLPRNKLCVALAWDGDVETARKRAEESRTGADIRFFTPSEGAMIWVDNLAIPADAPNPDGALAYINYMLKPSAVSPQLQGKLHGAKPPSAALAQLRKEAWARVKAAR